MSDWLGYVLLRLQYGVGTVRKEQDMTSPLQVGDRVTRPQVHGGELRIGVVTECYKSKRSSAGQQEDLYEVEWGDTGCRERGYLRVGLNKMD